MKHSEETRRNALEMIERDGVAKTHEATGISMQTLYKWRSDAKKAAQPEQVRTVDEQAVAAAREALAQSEAAWADEREKLTAENAKLRAENAKLRDALRALLG